MIIKDTKYNKNKENKRSRLKTFRNYFLFGIILISLVYVSIFNPSITGLTTGSSNQIVQSLDLTFDSYSAYSFKLEGKPSSFKLSGTVEGQAKIYLLKGFDKYLIYETTENSGNVLTGFAIGIPSEILENETFVEEVVEVNETVIDDVVEVNETFVEENITNEIENPALELNDTVPNETEEIVVDVPEEIVEENITETPVEEIDEPANELGTISFSNSCIETCSLVGFDETVELVIEINGTLTLTSLSYTIEGSDEIIEEEINGTELAIINETVELLNETQIIINETEINVTDINDTLLLNNTLNFLESINCEEFSEKVLWSSGFSNDIDSVNYRVWTPKYNCESANMSDCFIGKIDVKTRIVSTDSPTIEGNGESYVQISNSETCSNPESASYSRYIAYDTTQGEDAKLSVQCGDNKNTNLRCGVEATSVFDRYELANCFGIKMHSTKYSIVDVFEVRYSLCEDENE